MTAIVEKELVRAPLASANGFLETFFATHAAPKGEGARLLLHDGDAAHSVIATLQPAHRPEDMTPRYHLRWEAESGGPYPVYDGELYIGADEDYDAFWLVLDGAYAPPGGPAEAASARGLLTEIRAEIEVLFSAQERAKLAR